MGTTKELSGLKLGLGCDNKVQLSWMQGQQTEGDKRAPFTGKIEVTRASWQRGPVFISEAGYPTGPC